MLSTSTLDITRQNGILVETAELIRRERKRRNHAYFCDFEIYVNNLTHCFVCRHLKLKRNELV